jgi:hypothetical protein
MPADTHGPFPFGAVQDLLAITRALYRASGDEPQRQAELQQIGRGLREALELAKRSGPGTMGRRAAWDWANKGTKALGELVADGTRVEPLVRAVAAKLKRSR